MLPAPDNAHSSPNRPSSFGESMSSNAETSSKRPKLAEEPVKKSILEKALASLVVEPCDYETPSSSTVIDTFQPMAGREQEYKFIEAHYANSFSKREPRPLFICGAPGCGKSATVHKILSSFTQVEGSSFEKSQMTPYTVRINCATDLSSARPSLLYQLIASRMVEAFNASPLAIQLGTIEAQTFENSREISEISRLQLVCSKINKLHLSASNQTENQKPLLVPVFLDEVDHILSSKTSFSKELHFLFSSWLEPWNIMSIICISNDRDLFDRSLPLLAQFTAKNVEEPIATLQFKPYSAEQLEQILQVRMGSYSAKSNSSKPSLTKEIEVQPKSESGTSSTSNTSNSLANPQSEAQIFDIKAKKFLCAKIAKLPGDQAGDVRILVDLAKSCILEAITRSKFIVTLDIVLHVWKIKMASQTPSDPIAPLPLIQKCVLISLIVASKSGSVANMRPTVIETAWKSVSKQVFISSVPDLSELWRAIELLESIGHVQITTERGDRKTYKLQNADSIKKNLSQDPVFKGFL